MSSVDFLFESIVRLSILAFLLLGGCTLALRFIKQPIERIRSVQISLLCIILAVILSQASWKPAINLPVLPVSESSPSAEHPGFDRSAISPAERIHGRFPSHL